MGTPPPPEISLLQTHILLKYLHKQTLHMYVHGDMYVVEKKAAKGSKCKISRSEGFKMTIFDRFHREAMGVRGLDYVSNWYHVYM